MLFDLRPGHLPQPGIGQFREPPRGPLPPLRRADWRPSRRQALRLRRSQVLADRLTIQPQTLRDLALAPARMPMRQDLRHIHHVEGSPCHRPPVPLTGGSFLFSDDQVHHDTHAVPTGNNVTRRLGNYVLTSRPCLGNYVIADNPDPRAAKVLLPGPASDAERTQSGGYSCVA